MSYLKNRKISKDLFSFSIRALKVPENIESLRQSYLKEKKVWVYKDLTRSKIESVTYFKNYFCKLSNKSLTKDLIKSKL
jgi:hypothetical protein